MKNTVRLQKDSFVVRGILDFETVPHLYQAGIDLFDVIDKDTIVIDFSGVSSSNSAGLALLIHWLRFAQQNHRKIKFVALPCQLYDLVCLSQLKDALPIARLNHLKCDDV